MAISNPPYAIVARLTAILLLIAAMAGCVGRPPQKPTITVSIQPQKYLLEQIAGDRWEVRCLLANGANPESYDPGMTHLLNLEMSAAYMRIGHIPFESAIINKVRNNNPDLRLYDTSEGVALIHGSHAHDAIVGDVDPHTWVSVRNAKKIAANMYAAIVELDPDGKTYYSHRFRELLRSLDSLDAAIDTLLAPCRGDAFVVWHPSLSYFARDYGLRQIALSPEGKEMSADDIAKAIEGARRDSAHVMLLQKCTDPRQALSINEQIGAATANINPLDYDWKAEMLGIAQAIAHHHNDSSAPTK